MVRMRTAAGVMEIIKEHDPDTAVTLNYLKRLIRIGAVPCVPVGRKKLVDADEVIRRLEAGEVPQGWELTAETASGTIRKVPVK